MLKAGRIFTLIITNTALVLQILVDKQETLVDNVGESKCHDSEQHMD